jgi:hypothetical protein
VQLDAVKSGRHGVLRRLHKLGDRRLDVGRGHRVGNRVRLQALGIGEHLALGRHRRWCHHLCAGRQVQGMPNAPSVHELDEHLGAAGMNRVGNLLPAGDLLGGKNAGDARVAQGIGRRCRAFADDQSGGRALRIILHHQIVGHVAGRATARQRAHDQAILQRKRSQRGLRQQQRHEISPEQLNSVANSVGLA